MSILIKKTGIPRHPQTIKGEESVRNAKQSATQSIEPPPEKLCYTAKEVCGLLSISRKTLQRLQARKLIHSLKVLRTHLFSRKEIERFLSECR